MATGFPKGIRRRIGLTQEDEDILACQLLSAFGWILFVLLVNFFVLHESNTVPQAEAVWVEPPPQPAAAPKLFEPLLARVQTDQQDLWRDFRPDDHKPNYYFLYRDQIRFVDRVPEKKSMVASLKPTVPVPEKKRVEKKPEQPPEKITTKPVEWVDLPWIESPKEASRVEPLRESPANPVPERIRVAMVKDLDMDIEVVRDAPTAVSVPDEPRQAPPRKSRVVEAVDVPMEIAQPKQSPSPETVVAAAAPAAVVRPSTAADFVALPMDVASEKGRPDGIPRSAGAAEKPSSARPLFTARAAEDAVSLSMNLNVGEDKGKPSRSGSEGSIKGESSSARLIGANQKSLGGIDLGSGVIVAKQKEPARPVEPETPKTAARIPLRQGPGQIPLGTPLAFRLGDVGEETNSGSAYLTRSTQLKKFLDGKRLPSTAVTISLEEQEESVSGGNGEVVGLSYSNSQIVLQYATGKQQVVSLVPGEPYPRFELRLAAGGASNVSVGTKLEEITSCLQTLQRVFKE